MKNVKPLGEEEKVYSGKIFEIVKQPMDVEGETIMFETARRSPGTRLIITKENEILLTKEFRMELDGYDYRLPGGKVFDTLEEYRDAREEKGDLLHDALEAAKKECREETGLELENIEHYQTTQAGATVEWDLFYFIVDDFKESDEGQSLESGEVIQPQWKTFEETKKMCLNGDVSEDRSVGILLKFLEDVEN